MLRFFYLLVLMFYYFLSNNAIFVEHLKSIEYETIPVFSVIFGIVFFGRIGTMEAGW